MIGGLRKITPAVQLHVVANENGAVSNPLAGEVTLSLT